MMTLLPPDPRRRIGAVLLLSLLLVLATGLALASSLQVATRAQAIDTMFLPAVRDVHGLTAAIDDARGMAALHILLRDEADLAGIETRLAARRQQIDRRLAAFGRRLADDTERAHHRRVLASLAGYWAAQDRLLAASRRSAADPAAAEQARALLTGESQRAFQQLGAELEAWWAYAEQAAERARAGQARQARDAAALAIGPLLLALLAAGGAAWCWRGRAAGGAGPVADAQRADLDQRLLTLRTLAHQTHLLAMNAAVMAARSGCAGQPPVPAAQAIQHLAAQVARQLGATTAEIAALVDGQSPIGAGTRAEAGQGGE